MEPSVRHRSPLFFRFSERVPLTVGVSALSLVTSTALAVSGIAYPAAAGDHQPVALSLSAPGAEMAPVGATHAVHPDPLPAGREQGVYLGRRTFLGSPTG